MTKKNRLTKMLDYPNMCEVEFRTDVVNGGLKVTIGCLDGERLSYSPDVEDVKAIMSHMREFWSPISTYIDMRDGVLSTTHSDGRYD